MGKKTAERARDATLPCNMPCPMASHAAVLRYSNSLGATASLSLAASFVAISTYVARTPSVAPCSGARQTAMRAAVTRRGARALLWLVIVMPSLALL